MTDQPTPLTRRYQVQWRMTDNDYDVVDSATNGVVDTCPSKGDAEVMALALNRVEMAANAYVIQIMAQLAEGGAQ